VDGKAARDKKTMNKKTRALAPETVFFLVMRLHIDKPLIHYEFTSLPASAAVAIIK
jgi:hypothetical protein